MNVFIILLSLSMSIFLGLIIVPLLSKMKTTQTILHYVKEHDEKNGTPTMGGIIFIATISAVTLIFIPDRLARFCLLMAVASGFVGLLDDIAKVKFGKNMGLAPYQKIIAQAVLAGVFGYYIWWNVGSQISIPFFSVQVDIGVFIIPLLFVAFIATTNTVNLTDGLDGLCSVSVIACLLSLSGVVYFQMQTANQSVLSYVQSENFYLLIAVSVFSILGFLLFNANKASVFMGDVGSLFLGGLVVSLFAISKNIIYLTILGMPFVVSGVSDILQVAYFKKTGGKRIFLMAPYHHHLQRKGLSENKICVIYFISTMLLGLVVICFI
ncbi:MAG: phospho-N-acetylmuramoyl-pentapeptide-transferase [Bacillota bacterium]